MLRSDAAKIPHGKLTVVCSDWRVKRQNTLRGFATIEIVQIGFTIHDVGVHESHGKFWAALPGRPWVEGDRVVRDDAGKVKYSQIIEISPREVRDAFSAAVVRAVNERFPTALEREVEAAT
jgi:hypothetical protein